MTAPTDEQRRMAQMLNLHPDMPEDWPMAIIDWLIDIKATQAPDYYAQQLHKVLRRHQHVRF
jgi:hypothetical protein